jgi:peptidoglycan/LPS O-acetylase OafA/YrhL
MTGGDASVQTFFMISGFYIYLILNGKYRGAGGGRTFYVNRFLRLYPIYWFALLFTLMTPWFGLGATANASPLFYWYYWFEHMDWKSTAFAGFANIAILGQDWLHFLKLSFADHSLHFADYRWWEDGGGWKLLTIRQAWSLGIEVSFYLVAPWLLTRGWKTVAYAAAASLLLRIVLFQSGFNQDPWLIRFFPTELLFFCVGALACHFYQSQLAHARVDRRVLGWAFAVAIAATASFQFVPIFHRWSSAWAYYAVIASLLPYLFKATADSRLDRFLGELSYPLYISHYTLVRLIGPTDRVFDDQSVIECLGWSLLLAYALIRLSRPIEALRERKAAALHAATRKRAPRARKERSAA